MRADQVHLKQSGGTGFFALMAEVLTFQQREPDRFEHRRDRFAPAATPRRGLLDGLDNWFWKRRQRALEVYLGKAQDVFELEARIRNLERGAVDRCY